MTSVGRILGLTGAIAGAAFCGGLALGLMLLQA